MVHHLSIRALTVSDIHRRAFRVFFGKWAIADNIKSTPLKRQKELRCGSGLLPLLKKQNDRHSLIVSADYHPR
jgi:hypothetical protein